MFWHKNFVKDLLQHLDLACGHNSKMNLRPLVFVFLELKDLVFLDFYVLRSGSLDVDCVRVGVFFVVMRRKLAREIWSVVIDCGLGHLRCCALDLSALEFCEIFLLFLIECVA
jgi:hypothetical protein